MATMELWVLFLLIGGFLIITEIVILQMAVGWVFALGLGALIAGMVGYWVPDMPLSAFLGVMSACFIGVFVLFRVYRRHPEAGGDMSGLSQAFDPTCLGQIVDVTQSVSSRTPGLAHWSGSQWSALTVSGHEGTEHVIETGDQGKIVGVRGNTLIIEPVASSSKKPSKKPSENHG